MSKRDQLKDIFYKNESLMLEGPRRIRLVYLVSILVLTFLSLAFVFGGYRQLKERMDNPFTNWVDVEVPMSKIEDPSYLQLEEKLEDKSLLESYSITNQTDYTIGKWTIVPNLKEGFGYFEIRTRTFTEEDDNLKRIVFAKDNIIYQNQNISVEDSSKMLVLTEKLYQDLGYLDKKNKRSFDSDNLRLLLRDRNEDDLYHLLPVSHIVKELPGNANMLASSALFMALEGAAGRPSIKFDDYCANMLPSVQEINIVSPDSISRDDVIRHLPSTIVLQEFAFINSIYMGHDGTHFQYELKFRNEIPFRTPVSFPDSVSLQKIIKSLNDNGIYAIAKSQFDEGRETSLFEDYRSFYFSDLSKVVDFRNFAKRYNFDINIIQVESRNNFYLVTILARFFIAIILLLSILAIILYLQNVVSNHLEKIKGNLGTLMAFGLSKKAITSMYLKVVLRYFLKASAIAFIVLTLVYFIDQFLLKFLMLDVMDYKILLIWIGLSFVLLLYFSNLIKRILYKSPGELIYNRD